MQIDGGTAGFREIAGSGIIERLVTVNVAMTRSIFPLFFLLTAISAHAQSADPTEFFEKKIRPVFVKSCQGCHNAKMKSSGLDLSSAEGFTNGGASGQLVAKDQPETSRLLHVIGYEESLKMPPTGKLKPEEIADITAWVKMGASWPGAPSAPIWKPAAKKEFTAEQKAYWAFQPIQAPAVPTVKHAAEVLSPVDAFILQKLEEKGIEPAKPADRATLLRRVSYDLTGLPPTEQEMREFLADRAPNAYEKVVDRLLASPRYGEKWGRHWLDVARYADSTGNDEDHRYPYAWRYRDYVIQAFNDDLPYDVFVREQIAGDLMPSPDPGKPYRRGIIATGFLALGPKALAQVDKKKMLYDVWDEEVDVTSKAFLGLTMSCARCHDHKFDPILTKDYYSMVGMMASTKSFRDPTKGVATLLYTPLVPKPDYDAFVARQDEIKRLRVNQQFLLDPALERYAQQMLPHTAEYMLAARGLKDQDVQRVAKERGLGQEVLARWSKFLRPGNDPHPFLKDWYAATAEQAPEIARVLQEDFTAKLADYGKKLAKWRDDYAKKIAKRDMVPGDRPGIDRNKGELFHDVFVESGPFGVPAKDRLQLLDATGLEAYAALSARIEELKKLTESEPDLACSVEEGSPVNQKVLMRGDYNNPGEDAPKAVPAILAKYSPPQEFHGSGRFDFAEWLTRPDHPLTARVMANRIWQWHFGDGIVATPDNFGRMGARPTNQELLDYLASEFIRNGWSIKKLQKTIVLSSAYQRSSMGDEKSYSADPEDTLLSRFPRRRLDVEELRDGMLAVDGNLDFTMGGTLQKGFGTDGENSSGRLSLNPEKLTRRTVYLPIRRSNLPTLFNLFDFGDATTVTGKRVLTNVAPQALFMMNSEFVADRARSLAFQVLDNDALAPKDKLAKLFVRILNREVTPTETDNAFTYMAAFRRKFAASEFDAWQSFCRILLTSNEFLYLD